MTKQIDLDDTIKEKKIFLNKYKNKKCNEIFLHYYYFSKCKSIF